MRAAQTFRAGRGQQGASLVVVLAFMAFVAAVVPAVLGLAFTGLRVSAEASEQRDEAYAAESAIEVAVATAVQDPTVGSDGACETLAVTLDGVVVEVTCRGYPDLAKSCGEGSRVIGYLAAPASGSGASSLSALVVFQDLEGDQVATTTDWDTDSGEVPVPTSTPCDFPEATTTTAPSTTSTTTTTTTTTTVPPTTTAPTTTTTTEPLGGLTTEWLSEKSVRKGSTKWYAEGVVQLRDRDGGKLKGTRVVVEVEYLDSDGEWVDAPDVTKKTDGDGRAVIRSKRYRRSGDDSVSAIRLTIVGLEDSRGREWDPDAFPVTVAVKAP